MVKFISLGGKQQSPRAKTVSYMVPLQTGVVASVSTFNLLAPVTYAKVSGNSNLTINSSTGAVSATSALTSGSTQSMVGTVTGADGVVIPFTVNLTGNYVISISPSSPTITLATAAGSLIASISGVPSGQTPTISPGDGRFVIAGSQAAGWKIVRGLTAVSIGTANITVAAPGATSLSATISVTNDITSVRGADTKASAAGVNLGALLPIPMVATSSTYTLVSGTSGHWNLPTNGTHPTPTSAGVTARLNGGPYVFNYSISDGTNTVAAKLTITTDLGRTLPAYDYINKSGGRTTVSSETFTTACYTVSTTAEYNALTAANRSGATILVAKGVSGTVDLSMFGVTPTNPCLVQSEDVNNPSTISRVVMNTGGNHRVDSVNILMTKTAATAAFGNANVLRTTGNTSNIRFSNIIVGAPAGSSKSDYPSISMEQATDLHFRNSRLVRYATMGVRYQTRPVFKSLVAQYFNVDAFFFGNANNEVWTDGVFEDIIGSEPHWIPGDQNHPDAGQFFTTATAGSGIQLTGTMVFADVRFYGGAGDLSFNGFGYTGSGTGFPKLQGTVKMFGLAQSSLTSYAAGHLGNADYSASVATEMYGQTAVRQLTGVTGSISGGKGSGAQGFDTWSDDGTTSNPSTNQRYPGHYQSFAWPTGCNLKVIDSYFDGQPPTTVGTMDISKATYKNKLPSSTDPSSLTPAQINDNSAYFDDPNRVVNWAGMTPEQIDAIYADMYATKAGGPLDNGDGTVRGRWCVRRNGATAKPNQKGRTSLSLAVGSGTATATLTYAISVSTIVDVRYGTSNGTLMGTITIPAGSTTASIPLVIQSGATLVGVNDVGLLNPTIVST